MISIRIFSLTLALWSSVVLASKPQRIISATVTSDEIVWELLKTPAERSRILAFSPMVDDPSYSHIFKEVKGVSQRFPASAEGIVKLNPDFVILSSFNNPSYKSILDKLKISNIELKDFRTLGNIADHIQSIGDAIGKADAAKDLRSKFNDELVLMMTSGGRPKVRPTVLMYSSTGNSMAGDTLFHSIVHHCGGENLASRGGQKGWPQLNKEAILKLNPDFIVVSDSDQKSFEGDQTWQLLAGAKCKNTISIRNADLWSGSHYVMNAVRTICNAIRRNKKAC